MHRVYMETEESCATTSAKYICIACMYEVLRSMSYVLYLSKSTEPPFEWIEAPLRDSKSSSSVIFSSTIFEKLAFPSRNAMDSLADLRCAPLWKTPASDPSTTSSIQVGCAYMSCRIRLVNEVGSLTIGVQNLHWIFITLSLKVGLRNIMLMKDVNPVERWKVLQSQAFTAYIHL